MTSLPPTFASYSSSRIFSRRACSSELLSLFRAIVKPPALCFYSILLWRFTQLWGWPHPFTAFPRHSVKTGGNRKSAHFGDTLPGIVQAFCLQYILQTSGGQLPRLGGRVNPNLVVVDEHVPKHHGFDLLLRRISGRIGSSSTSRRSSPSERYRSSGTRRQGSTSVPAGRVPNETPLCVLAARSL